MYRNILVPIDLSEPSSWQKALPIAIEMSRTFGARIHVMTVVRDPDAIWRSQYSLLTYESMISDAEKRLASVIADSIPKELAVQRTVGHGSIYAEVLRTARESSADLIVMASHRPEMKDYLIGANAARVVRHARCSVLVVRES